MTSVADKLRLKPGARIRVVNPPPGFAGLLGPLPVDARFAEDPGEVDAVILFATDSTILRRDLAPAVRAAAGDRLLWVVYPKGGSRITTDLNRDRVAGQVAEAAVTAVAQVAIDADWSALRLRPSDRYRS